MSDPRFPWGSNNPTRVQRSVAAGMIAAFGVGILLLEYARHPGYHPDFGMIHFGARALLEGRNPYELIGPGKEYDFQWRLLYPAPALIVGIPFTLLSEPAAASVFVWLSTFVLAFGMTRDSWHRLPLFATEAFASSARLAQWSPLIAAGVFYPLIAVFTIAKPHVGAAVLACTTRRRAWASAAVGAAVLGTAATLLFPAWPSEWVSRLGNAPLMRPPVLHPGGFLILTALLRWRRPEAWLLVSTALIPQTWGWYSVLILFTIPATFKEAGLLALGSNAGTIVAPFVLPYISPLPEFQTVAGTTAVLTTYLPATILVLRRRNEGEMPVWLSMFAPLRARIT